MSLSVCFKQRKLDVIEADRRPNKVLELLVGCLAKANYATPRVADLRDSSDMAEYTGLFSKQGSCVV